MRCRWRCHPCATEPAAPKKGLAESQKCTLALGSALPGDSPRQEPVVGALGCPCSPAGGGWQGNQQSGTPISQAAATGDAHSFRLSPSLCCSPQPGTPRGNHSCPGTATLLSQQISLCLTLGLQKGDRLADQTPEHSSEGGYPKHPLQDVVLTPQTVTSVQVNWGSPQV